MGTSNYKVVMSEIKPLTLVSGYSLGVLISEHKKILSEEFSVPGNQRFPRHPKNKCLSQTHTFKCGWHIVFLIFLLSVLIGISFVSALTIGNGIKINITIDNSTIPYNSSENETNPVIINDGSSENQTEETTSTSSDNQNDEYDAETDSSITDDPATDSSLDETQNQDFQEINQDESDDFVTGAAVSTNPNVSNKLKIGLSMSTIILSAIFLSTLFFYKRRLDEENKIITKKHKKK